MSESIAIEKKNIKGSMTEGNPVKCMLLFAVPMILGNLFQQFYMLADSMIVGNYVGSDALAAVGASNAITGLFVMVAMGTGIGCSVVISQLFGAGKIKEMKTAISTALISILIFSLILSVLGVIFSSTILHWQKTPDEVFKEAKLYLDIYFYGFFFLFLYNAFSAVFNALGDSKKPLIFLIFSSLLNIGLDIYFVRDLGLGIAGAAWATLIAQGVSAALSFVVLMYKLSKIHCEKYRRFDTEVLGNMVRVAIPTVIQQSMISIGMLLIQGTVNGIGKEFLAGYTAACRIDGMAIVPMVNAGNAVSTFVAQNMGAQKPERAKQGYHIGLVMAMGIGLFIGVLMFFFGEVSIAAFMDSGENAKSIAIGAQYISVVSMFYFVMGAMNVTSSVLRGAGDMKWFLAITLINLGTRVILTYLLAEATAGMIIMWANPIGWGIGLILSYVRYRQGGWKKIRLV